MIAPRPTLLLASALLTATSSFADDWAIQRAEEQRRSDDLFRQQRETANRNAEFTRQSNLDINRQFEASRRAAQVKQGQINVELARLNHQEQAARQPAPQATRPAEARPQCREKFWTHGTRRLGESAVDKEDGTRHALVALDLLDADDQPQGVLFAEFGASPGPARQPINRFSSRQVNFIIGEDCSTSAPVPRCGRYFLALAGELENVEYVAGSARGSLSARLWNGRFIEWNMASWAPVPHGDCVNVSRLDVSSDYAPRTP